MVGNDGRSSSNLINGDLSADGVSRLIIAASAVSEDGVKVVRGLGSIVERAAKL
jgi:hypothetical protein